MLVLHVIVAFVPVTNVMHVLLAPPPRQRTFSTLMMLALGGNESRDALMRESETLDAAPTDASEKSPRLRSTSSMVMLSILPEGIALVKLTSSCVSVPEALIVRPSLIEMR